jgi:hypothetical protein
MTQVAGVSKSLVYVYLSSVSRSGSTLLAFLLNAHPEIASIGELTGPHSTRYCSCGELFEACDFWARVGDGMHERGMVFDPYAFGTRIVWGDNKWLRQLRTGSLGSRRLTSLRDAVFQLSPGYRAQVRELVSRNIAVAEIVREISGKRVFLDTSKHYSRIKYLQKYADVDLRVIHLVRDVRGVVASILRKYDTPASHVARLWVKRNRQIYQQLQVLSDDQRILVRYEDLCSDPLSTLRQLHEFCGVEVQGELLDFRRVPHHIVGNAMRRGGSSEIRQDLRWKDELSERQLEEIDRITAGERRVYGY